MSLRDNELRKIIRNKSAFKVSLKVLRFLLVFFPDFSPGFVLFLKKVIFLIFFTILTMGDSL